MEICGNCDWASGGARSHVFCEKRMGLVPVANNCPKWRVRILPEGFLFKSDIIDISHIDPNAPPIDMSTFEPPKEEPTLPSKPKRKPNKPKVIPPPPIIQEEDEDIFA